MKKIEGFILRSCGYTVLLALIVYAFLGIIGIGGEGITIVKFLVILGYGFLISCAGALYASLPIHKAYRAILHYLLLLGGFIVLYLTSGAAKSVTASRVFIAIVLFTILYAASLGLIKLVKHMVKKADSKVDLRTNSKAKNTPAKKSAYKPRFGGSSK